MQTIQRFFGVFLLLACGIGLIVPSAGKATSAIVICSLAFIIFCSYFQIGLSKSDLFGDFPIAFRFWLLRYALVPVAAYFLCLAFDKNIAVLMLLSFLLPAAVSSPSFNTIFGGNPDLSLKILVYSSFFSVITIPVLMRWLPDKIVPVSIGKMLLTLVYTLIVPFIIHLPFRQVPRIKEFTNRYNPAFTLVGLSVLFIVVTANNKPVFITHPEMIVVYAILSFLLYVLLYLTGYYLCPFCPNDLRKTFSISSGANNIGLGVTLTALFFPGPMNVFFIVSQLSWVIILIPLRKVMAKLPS
jgi:predicted Na+-dependent transporter